MAAVSAHELTRTRDCKIAGCANASTGITGGTYAFLCEEHTEEAKRRRYGDDWGGSGNGHAPTKNQSIPRPAVASNGSANGKTPALYEERVRKLLPAARSVDRAAAAHRKEAAKVDAKLARLNELRQQLDADVVEALRLFRQEVRELAGPEPLGTSGRGD